jgi:hypothetical protein
MRKRVFWAATLVFVLLMAGLLYASNMGFKLNYSLPGGGLDGTIATSLPYNQQVTIDSADDLLNEIPSGVGVGFHNQDNNLGVRYTGVAGSPPDFALVPGDGYYLTVTTAGSYVIVGSHDPSLEVAFSNGGLDGTTLWSYPYHSQHPAASDLLGDIPSSVGVGFFNRDNNLGVRYTGVAGSPPDFALVVGDAYFITVTAPVASYTPKHY